MRIVICLLILICASAAAYADVALVPPVHERAAGTGFFIPGSNTIVEAPGELGNEADFLRRMLKTDWKLELGGGGATAGAARIVLAVRPAGQEVPEHPEGYFLRVAPGRIDLQSTTPAGIYYGLVTLRQLMQPRAGGVGIPACAIRDWPDLDWRAAYLNLRFVAAGDEPQRRLHELVRAFASLKYNKLLLEISDNMIYDGWNWPDRATPAFNRENLKALAEEAKRNHIEIIPYLQTISHTIWIRSNAKLWEQIKEGDTAKMWDSQYCPSNPTAQKLIHDVIAEQVRIIQPRFFHIGLDEISDGPFGACPVCRKKDPVELYRQEVLRICGPLISAGVRPIAYQDGFEERTDSSASRPPQGWKIIDQMPRELIINAWNYSPELGKSFAEHVEWFSKKGFDVVGASYQSPRNVLTMPRAIKANGRGLGTILTYWYDVESWEKFDSVSPAAWATTTLAAMGAWNMAASTLESAPHDLAAPIREAIEPHLPQGQVLSQPIDLSAAFNGSFGGGDGAIPGRPAAGVLGELAQSREFILGGNGKHQNVVALSGRPGDGLPAAPVVIPINRQVRGLEFLQTCDRPFSDSKWNIDPNGKTLKPVIGRYRIRYADGKEQVVELRYNWNIVDWNAPFAPLAAAVAYAGHTDDGGRLLLVKHRWINPDPQDIVVSAALETAQMDGMSPALLGLNAIVADPRPVEIDSFDYPSSELSRRWRILEESRGGHVEASTATEASGRRGVLSVRLPATTAGASGRVMLDKQTPVPAGARQISFWLYLENPDALAQSGVYIGNDNFQKSGGLFRVAKAVKGWQQVVVPLDSLSGIELSEATWLRLSFWIKEQSPPVTILVDDVQWIHQPARSANTRTNWYE